MIDEREKCRSCDTLWVEHYGVERTCKMHLHTRAQLDEAVNLLGEARKAIQYSGLMTADQMALVTDKIHAFLAKVSP